MGVYRDKRRKNQWGVRIMMFGKRRSFGSYKTKKEAEAVAESILKKYESMKKQTIDNYRPRYAKTKPGHAMRILPITLFERIIRKFRKNG